eukprot:2531809-Rhodomonas_salina.1
MPNISTGHALGCYSAIPVPDIAEDGTNSVLNTLLPQYRTWRRQILCQCRTWRRQLRQYLAPLALRSRASEKAFACRT